MKAEPGFLGLRDDYGELIFRTERSIKKTVIDDPQFQISRGIVEEVAQIQVWEFVASRLPSRMPIKVSSHPLLPMTTSHC